MISEKELQELSDLSIKVQEKSISEEEMVRFSVLLKMATQALEQSLKDGK